MLVSLGCVLPLTCCFTAFALVSACYSGLGCCLGTYCYLILALLCCGICYAVDSTGLQCSGFVV